VRNAILYPELWLQTVETVREIVEQVEHRPHVIHPPISHSNQSACGKDSYRDDVRGADWHGTRVPHPGAHDAPTPGQCHTPAPNNGIERR
jgi:hypothetical protein